MMAFPTARGFLLILMTVGTVGVALVNVGLATALAASIFCSLLAGNWLGSHEGVEGYRIIFIFLIAMLLIGAVFVVIWMKYLKKKNNQRVIESKEE